MEIHPSNVKDLAEVQGYRCDKEKCICNAGVKLHCSLCDSNRLPSLTPAKLQSHVSAVHWNHKLLYKDIFVLCCNLNCFTGNHFHCPNCSSVHSRLSRIKQHLEECESKDDSKRHITTLNSRSIPEISSEASFKTAVPSNGLVVTSVPPGDNEMHQHESFVLASESEVADDEEATVYIIQEGDVNHDILEAIRQSQMNADTSEMMEIENETSGLSYKVVNLPDGSGDGVHSSESVVMVINQSELDSSTTEQLQSGQFILQSGDDLDQVVLLSIPENEGQHGSIEEIESCDNVSKHNAEENSSWNLQKELGQYYHESFVKDIASLVAMVCGTAPYHCPLCDDPEEELMFHSLNEIEAHLDELHWNKRISHMGFSIVSCGLSCAIDKVSSSNDFHWHCPHCWMTTDFASMKSHVRSHTEVTRLSIFTEDNVAHKKTVKLKQMSPAKTGPPRKRGRPSNSERIVKYVQDILEDVIDAVVTGEKSWAEEEDTENDFDKTDEVEITQPQVVSRFGDDGRELVIRTRRQHGVESGVSPSKYKRKFIEIDSDDGDEVMIDDDNDEDYSVPDAIKRPRHDAEERSLEMLLLAAEKTEPTNAENMQLAVSADGDLLLQSVDENDLKSGANSSKRKSLTENVLCPSCHKPFRKKQQFYQHLFSSKCHKNEDSLPNSVIETIQDALTNVNGRSCPLCSKDFCDMHHTRVHYALRTCQNTFVGKMGYERNEETGKYKCHYCEFTSLNPRVLVAHEAREHVDKKDYECSICHRKYAFHVLLQRHLKTTHFAPSLPKCQCDVCGKTMYTKHIKQHMRMAHDPNYVKAKEPELDYYVQCDTCSFSTTFLKKLEKHKRKFHGEKDKECMKCGKSFSLKQDLMVHYKSCLVSIEERQEECPHCRKKMLKKNLKTHIDLVHKNNRRYGCPTCGKKFQTKYVLQCHIDTHRPSGDRIPKFLCGTCGKGFFNKTMLTDHINMHTGNKPYACKHCDKRFKCGPSLHRHLELHQGVRYNCRICGSMFTAKSYWKQHMKRHEEDVILRCDCGKEYQTQSGLKNHRQTCSAAVDAELAVEQLETQTIDGTTFLWSEKDQQILQLSSQELDGETLVVLETVQGDGSELMSTPVTGDDGEVVTIVQSDDQVVMETSLTEELIDQQVTFETTEEVDTMEGQDQFLCGHCQQTFMTMEEVQDHMSSHFEEFAVGDEINLAIQTAA